MFNIIVSLCTFYIYTYVLYILPTITIPTKANIHSQANVKPTGLQHLCHAVHINCSL